MPEKLKSVPEDMSAGVSTDARPEAETPTGAPAPNDFSEARTEADPAETAPERTSKQAQTLGQEALKTALASPDGDYYPSEAISHTFYQDDPDLAAYAQEIAELGSLLPGLEARAAEKSPIFQVQQGRRQKLAQTRSRLLRAHQHMSARIAEIKELGPDAYKKQLRERQLADAEQAAKLKQEAENREAARIAIPEHARALGELERNFKYHLDQLRSRGEQLDREDFEAYEDQFAQHWQAIQRHVALAKLDMRQQSRLMTGLIPFIPLKDTIEAQAGNFYEERQAALLNAIKQSDSPAKDRDYQDARAFFNTVAIHLDLKYMKAAGKSPYTNKKYNEIRTENHNNVILHLNTLNRLAQSYGTRPFTARTDYWTSSVEEKKQTGPMSDKMRYDRDVVGVYYQTAFDWEIERRDKKLALELDTESGARFAGQKAA